MSVSPIVSSLTSYVEEHRLPLIHKANLSGKTVEKSTLQTGVKYKSALNLLSTSIVFDDAKSCGFSASSDQTLSQRILSVNNVKTEVSYCVRQLLQYWMNYQVRVAAPADRLPFEEEFFADVIRKVNEKTDYWIWQGSTTVGATYESQVDGLIALATADANVIDVTIAAGTTKYAAVKQMVEAVPAAELMGEKTIFCSPEFLMGFEMELVDLNLYHFVPGKDIEDIQIPGTSIMLASTVGLTGSNKLFFANKSNLFYGVDMEGDAENLDVWYDPNSDTVRIRLAFNAGAQYAWGDRIVMGDIQ